MTSGMHAVKKILSFTLKNIERMSVLTTISKLSFKTEQ